MKVVCPTCGAASSLEAYLNDAVQRQFSVVLAALPLPVATQATHYVGLFRPLGGRGLSWKKALRLIAEVQALAAMDTVQWGHGVARPLTPAMLGMAMERMIVRPPRRLPLDNHNYLRSIAYDIADEADRKSESSRNAAERSGFARPARENTEQAEGLGEVIDRSWMKDIRTKNMGESRLEAAPTENGKASDGVQQ